VPSEVLEVTFVTVGAVVSTTSALLNPRDPDVPGDASERVLAFPTASLIAPPFNVSADVEM
jgi:hypothetical protein